MPKETKENLNSTKKIEIEQLIKNDAISLINHNMTNKSNVFRFRSHENVDDSKNLNILNTEILTSRPNAEEIEDEQEIYPSKAVANTEYTKRSWITSEETFKADNSIYGKTGHWESKRNVKSDFWEAIFNQPYKFDVIEIDFLHLPKFFKVFYKLKENSPYIACTTQYQVSEYIDPNTAKKTNLDLVSKTYALVFNKPIFASRIKILLTEHIYNNYFAINKVRFFQKRKLVMVKNELLDICNDYCFFINTNIPRNNIPVEAYKCIEIVNLADNREMYVYYNDRSLRLSNDKIIGSSNKCVGFNGARELVLKTCNDFETTYAVDLKQDGTLYFHGYEDSCIYIDGSKSYSKNFVDENTQVLATSEGDLQTYKKENVRIYGNNYWSSNPGEVIQNFQIMFGKFNDKGIERYEMKKVDVIKVEWQRYPKAFKVYVWKPGSIWLLKRIYTNYNLKDLEINLTGEQISAIMFVMEEGYNQKDLGNRVAYAITNLYIGTRSYALKVGKCDKIKNKYKIFDFDNQIYRNVDRTAEYQKARYKLEVNYMLLKLKYQLLLKDKQYILQAKDKALEMHRILATTAKHLREKGLERFKKFRYIYLKKIMNNEFSRIIEKNELKNVLFPLEDYTFQLGTRDLPAEDCLSLKRLKKSIVSGFYYIKPKCSEKTLRVFCDFSILKGAIDIYVFNDESELPNPDLFYLNIKKLEDIRYQCAKLGLEPIRILNQDIVQRISQILYLKNYNLNMPIAIPLGYDYGCEDNNCEGFYRSLDSRESPVINDMFQKSTSNVNNLHGKGLFIGLGFSTNPELISYNLTTVKLGGLICSTNHVQNDYRDESISSISCDTKLSGNHNMFPLNNDITVRCPSDCNLFKGKVYGNGIYHSYSSICLAAIHAGVITRAGGIFNLKVTSHQTTYKALTRHNIISLEYSIDDGLPSFIMEKYTPQCPLDLYKNNPIYYNKELETSQKSSYMEVSFNSLLLTSSTTSEAEYYLHSAFNYNYLMKMTKAVLQGSSNKTLSQNKNNTEDHSSSKKKNKKKNETSLQFIKNKEALKEDNSNNENNGENQVTRNVIPQGHMCYPNTDTGISLLKTRKEEIDWSYFEDIKTKKSRISDFINKFLESLSWSLSSSNISNTRLELLLRFLLKFKSKLSGLIKIEQAKAMARKIKTIEIFDIFNERYIKLIERDDFILNYLKGNQLLTKHFKKFDFINPNSVSSKWIITVNDIKSRTKAIGLKDIITNHDHPAASFLILQNKNYYDFNMSVDLLFKSVGIGGVAFRYKDSFNYYAIKINRIKGYKEIIKVRYGEVESLKIIKDGGTLVDTWINIKVKGYANNFEIITYYPESEGDKENVIEFNDSDIASGSIAFFVNEIEGFFFDNFRVTGDVCWTPWVPKKNIKILPNTSNSYIEPFKGNFNLNYEIIDPPSVINGPSIWKMISNPKNSEEDPSIIQASEVYDASPYNRPSMIILKEKFLRDGLYRVEFIPNSEMGVISVIFKYNKFTSDSGISTDSYYTFDLINDHSGDQFSLKRIEHGISKELKIINNLEDIIDRPNNFKLGYTVNIPHFVQVIVNKGEFIISLSVNSRPYVTVMKVNDHTFKIGEIGIGIYRVKLTVLSIELRPLDFRPSYDQINEYLMDGKDEILLNDNDYNDDDSSPINVSTKNPNEKRDNMWKQCIKRNTSSEREEYCLDHFTNEHQVKTCILNFCDSCCSKSIFFKHKNIIHICKKTCQKNTKGEKNEINKNTYLNICINSTHPETSVYNYCDGLFMDPYLNKVCKYDMCNLCCVNLSPISNKDSNPDSLKQCFKSCSNKFYGRKK